jgi:Flp pilus assembly protein TadD
MTTELIHEAGLATKRGLLARYAGVVDADIAAIRRRAMADEARQEWAHALDAYRIGAILEPGDAELWRGLARCYAKLGDEHLASQMARCAEAVARRFP